MFGGRRVRSRSQRRNRSTNARRNRSRNGSRSLRRSRSGSRSRSRSRSRSGSRNRNRRTRRRQSRGGGEGTFATPTDVKLTLFQINKDPEVIFEGKLVPVYKNDMNRDKESEQYITEKFTGEGTLNLNIGLANLKTEAHIGFDNVPDAAAPGNKAVVKLGDEGVDFYLLEFNETKLSEKLQKEGLLE